MGRSVEAQGKLEHVLEELGENHLTLAMGQPVGMERDKRAAGDHEQPEADPGADQWEQLGPGECRAAALRMRELVDDPAEQDGLGELGASEQDIGEGKHPAQPDL